MSFPEKKWRVFLVVATGVFMSTLDSSIVNIALPSIMATFGSPLGTTEWVVMIYLLTITATLLMWGGLSDRLGRGRIYSVGLLIFAAGSLACAGAGDIFWLVAARFFQATGAAMMMSTGPAIVKEAFPKEQIGRAFGLIGVTVSFGLMTGPPLGGFLVEYFSWRSIFLVTVPIGFLFSLLARAAIPPNREEPPVPAGFDWTGALSWAGALAMGMLVLSHLTSPDWPAPLLAALAAGCIFLLFLFLRTEAERRSPMLPLHLFRQRYFSMAVISAVISFLTLFTVTLLTPFYLVRVLGLDTARAGLVMMSVPLCVMVVAPAAGWLSDHLGSRHLATAGLAISTAALVFLAFLTAEPRTGGVVWRLALLGAGQAMFLSPNSASVLGRVDRRFVGISAGLLATARNMGMSLGVALAGLIFAVLFRWQTGGLDMRDFSPAQTPSFMLALKGSFLTAALLGALGVWCSWRRGADIR